MIVRLNKNVIGRISKNTVYSVINCNTLDERDPVIVYSNQVITKRIYDILIRDLIELIEVY